MFVDGRSSLAASSPRNNTRPAAPTTPSPPLRPLSAQTNRQSRSSITSAFHVQLSRPVMLSPPQPSACSGQQRRRRTRRRLAEGAYRRRRPRVIIFRHFALIAPPRRRFECTREHKYVDDRIIYYIIIQNTVARAIFYFAPFIHFAITVNNSFSPPS